MATRAHSTRTPLLPLPGAVRRLLQAGTGKQVGPVTAALQTMQAADPERQRIREFRRAIAEQIDAGIALLDALDGDPDFEADPLEEQHDAEDCRALMRGGHAA